MENEFDQLENEHYLNERVIILVESKSCEQCEKKQNH